MINKKLGIILLFAVFIFPVISKGEIKDIRIQAKNSIKEAKTEARKNAKKEREEFRGEVKSIRATSTLKNILEKREALKVDLKKIKNERKSQIVENADKKLEKINDDRMNHLLDVLNNLEKTLAKINTRISAAQAKGIDVSSAKKVADDAAKAIAAARTAVEAQAAEVYKMTITDENKLKADVGNTVKKLQDDLKQIRIVVQSAHDVVRKAAAALAKAMGIEDKPKSSSSASVSSS